MLSNKVIFITGASGVSGISHINLFLERDAKVIATDVDDEGVFKIINKFKNHENKNKLIVLKLDVTCEISIGKVLKEVIKYKPNVFINNAAITGEQLAKSRDYSSKLSEMTYNQWKQAIDVNLSSAFMIAKEVDKYYVGKYPIKVINIASIYGSMAPHHCLYESSKIKPFPAYSASKAGLHGLTLWLCSYWAKSKVTVNTLSPGGIFNHQDEELVHELSKLNVLGRMADAKEVSTTLAFMVSDDSNFMTGQNIFVDGGFTAW